MALLHGVNGNFPCPVCLVPQESQWDLSQNFALRTKDDSRHQFLRAMEERTLEKHNEILKMHSIRPIEVGCLFIILSG
jgi:hypothetical protein